MSQRLPFVSLVATAVVWLGFALWLGSHPQTLLDAFGISESTSQMHTEIRAFYGGVELAIAALMALLWFQGQRRASLLVGAFPLIGSAFGRGIGLIVDGFSGLHLGFACIELAGAAFCLLGYYVLAGSVSGGSGESNNA